MRVRRVLSWRVTGFVAAALLLAATGCAGPPKNVLAPVAIEAPGTTQVSLLVATTRSAVQDPGEMYSGDRALDLTFAEIVVSIPPDGERMAGEVQWPQKLPPDPAKEFAVVSASYLDREEARSWFETRIGRAPGQRR